MATDDQFEPKLGKIRAQAPKPPKSFRSKVLHATAREGGSSRPKIAGKPSRGGASKRGRGAGVGRVLSSASGRPAGQRRVVVKARYIKLAGKGLGAAAAHLKYIQRDGVTREGQAGQLYGPETEQADGKAFMERSASDTNQFRFIVAPEDGQQYDDLKPVTRKLMTQMEADLETKLDWVAVDHYNTGHPHTHIVIRGIDDRGQPLVIGREYISQAIRARAEAQVTLDLGPRSDLEISARLKEEIDKPAFTSIDRQLVHDAGSDGRVTPGHQNPEISALRMGRLAKLKEMGFAENVGQGIWSLRGDMEATLRRLGERGDIIKAMHRDLQERGLGQALAETVIHTSVDARSSAARPITGRLIKRGLADELNDRHYLLVDGTDGRIHYVDIGVGDRTPMLVSQAIVLVQPKAPEVRQADRTILDVANRNDGIYDVAAHLKTDPTAQQMFAETHIRRLEAIRRSTGSLERNADGGFPISANYLDKALAYERREAKVQPATVSVLSDQSLDAQTRRIGVTWLDQELTQGGGAGFSDTGFGREATDALTMRRQWLVSQGLASQDAAGNISVKPDVLTVLHRRELANVAETLSLEKGLAYVGVQSGQVVEGKLTGSVTLGIGKFGVVERAKDFTLVPWRPVLEKHIDKTVSGLMREGGINWTIGRSRGPSVE
ncbi:relaxase/mobilization nuclease RlxS [Asticcacaulis sp.]|uniref:relaxase/mobilization nuclease RlxS n=1 Tax=Asticcacaulis sp. TaxID=1872648 RepID=UPI002BB2AA94|nr:relaxase/mobilization nuclease RlxS [Asticcacaulis sp.]HTM81579.1 relaxase/mobilization nuclease RlxS [Asticcacaulis sp.]